MRFRERTFFFLLKIKKKVILYNLNYFLFQKKKASFGSFPLPHSTEYIILFL